MARTVFGEMPEGFKRAAKDFGRRVYELNINRQTAQGGDMHTYIGTKIIQAATQEKDGRSGYAVTYPDGYTSWSPREAFEEAYRLTSGMPFGLAIEALKKGMRVARAGWNGKGMWLSMSGVAGVVREVPADAFWSPNNRAYAYENGGTAGVLPCITMKTATGEILMGWLASQTDMFADDWMIVE